MKLIFTAIGLLLSFSAFSENYAGVITQIQAEGVGDPYNVLYLDDNNAHQESPCSSTQSTARFTIVNEAQMSAALTALVSGLDVVVQGSGICASNIEQLNYVLIKAR